MTMEILEYGLLIALAIALVFAAISDIRHRRIANWLNGAIALGAPLYWFASGMAPWPDMVIQLGFAIGVFAVCTGIFALGLIGGGDIKLVGAIALWLSPAAFVNMLLVMGVMGGLIAIGFIIRRVVFKPKTPGVLPYGVAIAVGALFALGMTYLPQTFSAGAVA